MPVVNQTKNPVNPREVLNVASGIIKRVNVKRLNADGSPRTVQTSKGVMNNTHQLSLVLTNEGDETIIGFGQCEIKNLKYENFQVKSDDKYVTLLPGMEVSCVVTSREYNGKTYYDGKRGGINILSTEGAVSDSGKTSGNSGATGSGSQQNTAQGFTGASVKVYGEVKGIDGSTITMTNQKDSKEYSFVVSKDQVKQLVVGGRLAANVKDGVVVSGFKAYGPVGAHQNSGGKKKDDLPVRLGNAVTVAANLNSSGVVVADLVKEVISETDKLRLKVSEKHKDMDEYSLGARLGQCMSLASAQTDVNILDEVISVAEQLFELICQTEKELRTGVAEKPAEQDQQAAPAPQAPAAIPDVPEFDFGDIPF